MEHFLGSVSQRGHCWLVRPSEMGKQGAYPKFVKLGPGGCVLCANAQEANKAYTLAYNLKRYHCFWCTPGLACVDEGMRKDNLVAHYERLLMPKGKHVIFSVRDPHFSQQMRREKCDEWRGRRSQWIEEGAKAFIQCSQKDANCPEAAGKIGGLYTIRKITTHKAGSSHLPHPDWHIQYEFEPSSLFRFDEPPAWPGAVHCSAVDRDDIPKFARALAGASLVSYLPPPA